VDFTEKIFNFNLKANENIIIAEKEKLVALELRKLTKNLLKKVKTREEFVKKETKLAQIRKNLVGFKKNIYNLRCK